MGLFTSGLLSTEVLERMTDLPVLALVAMLVISPTFFVFGYRVHRALVVASTTFIAGLFALAHGEIWPIEPIIAALLIAMAAGSLALSGVKVLLFVVCGVLVQSMVTLLLGPFIPAGALAACQWLGFVLGGIFSTFRYRFSIILTCGYVGAYLLMVSVMGLMFQHRYELVSLIPRLEDMTVASLSSFAIFMIMLSLTVASISIQYLLYRNYNIEVQPDQEPAPVAASA